MPFGSLSNQQRITVLLSLVGGPKYATQMVQAATATRALHARTQALGGAMLNASRRTWLQNQALFTFRRYAFYGTLAVTALIGAVVKLGYAYYDARAKATAALRPIITDQSKLNGYLDDLFRISKYSPFVLSDLTKSFSALYLALSPQGISGPTIINTLQSITDYLSALGQTTPRAVKLVTNALGDLGYAGYLTGRMYARLSQIGFPIQNILRTNFGIQNPSSSTISQYALPALQVLEAINRYARTNRAISGAAYRVSVGSLSGMLEVLRDTVSQISAGLLGGQFARVQNFFGGLLRPGGPLDRMATISKNKGGIAALMFGSERLTGSTGLAKSLLFIIDLLRRISNLFIHVIIPAFGIGLRALVVFWPILKVVGITIQFVTDHANVFKWVLAALAAEFVITHTAIFGASIAMKLFGIATFGALGPLRRLIGFLMLWNAVGLKQTIGIFLPRLVYWLELAYTWWVLDGMALRAFLIAWGPVALALGIAFTLYTQWGWFHRETNALWRDFIYFAPLVGAALAVAFGPIGAAVTGLLLIIRYWDRINRFFANTDYGTPNSPGFDFLGHPIKGHAGGGITNGLSMIGERGPELARFPAGTRIIPNRQMTSSLAVGGFSGGGSNGEPIVVQLVVDRKVLAEAVARHNQDVKARR